ncbi:hypothetical protein BDR06DRAFT_978203, partial [Suillus hirtellus]
FQLPARKTLSTSVVRGSGETLNTCLSVTAGSTAAGGRKEADPGTKATTPPSSNSDCSSTTTSVIRRFEPSGQTRSQGLFSITTGISPCSLTLQDSVEFYRLDLRAGLMWLSYQMTSKRWVLATEEYNRRLVLKKGESVVKKNYQALLRALGDIEPKLMNK